MEAETKMELPPFKLKGVNKKVVTWVEEKKQKELDEKFRSLPSIRPVYKNITLANFKKPGQDILYAYEFNLIPSNIISGLVILYQSGAGEIGLYPSMLIDNSDLEKVQADYQLDRSPFQLEANDLQKSFASKDGKYSIYLTADHDNGYEDMHQLLFAYYRWVYYTFISEEEVPEGTPILSESQVQDLEDFLS